MLEEHDDVLLWYSSRARGWDLMEGCMRGMSNSGGVGCPDVRIVVAGKHAGVDEVGRICCG